MLFAIKKARSFGPQLLKGGAKWHQELTKEIRGNSRSLITH